MWFFTKGGDFFLLRNILRKKSATEREDSLQRVALTPCRAQSPVVSGEVDGKGCEMSDKKQITPLGISLHAEVAQQLRNMILNLELKPGEKIDEPALCERFGVSRTPLREALKVLSMEGLIVLAPHRGARVALTSVEDVRDLFPIIGALEALAAELACQQVTELQIESLQLLHDEMVICYRTEDAAGYAERNREIHNTLFNIAGNAQLTQLYLHLSARTHAVRYVARKAPTDWAQAVAEHEQILEALRRRDGEQLGKILKEHLAGKAQVVIAFLENQQA